MAPTGSPGPSTGQGDGHGHLGLHRALSGGSYDVYVTFGSKSQYSRAAPFAVYDGGTSLETQSINEGILVTLSQGGRAQGSYGGVGWLELGTYAITGTELKVVLSKLRPRATTWTPTAC